MNSSLRVALAQIAPLVLDREKTLAKVVHNIELAAHGGAGMVAFGEALVPAYPVWLERLDGARFDSDVQKELHARYLEEGVCLERGDLDEVCAAAKRGSIATLLGIMERPLDRGGKALYCTSVFISANGVIESVHRKLVPTYEERLSWSPGDGAGLVVHSVGAFTVGRLLCWENWMALARAALQAQGEDLHVMHWPGGEHNSRETTRFIARESRSFVLSVSALIRPEDVPSDFPYRDRLVAGGEEFFCNGGSAIAGPDGKWLIEPVVGREELLFADLDPAFVRRERQNFDPAAHYSRPDVLRLEVDRRRQASATFRES